MFCLSVELMSRCAGTWSTGSASGPGRDRCSVPARAAPVEHWSARGLVVGPGSVLKLGQRLQPRGLPWWVPYAVRPVPDRHAGPASAHDPQLWISLWTTVVRPSQQQYPVPELSLMCGLCKSLLCPEKRHIVYRKCPLGGGRLWENDLPCLYVDHLCPRSGPVWYSAWCSADPSKQCG